MGVADEIAVTQLGYLGIGVSDLAAWEDFATRLLGLQDNGRSPAGHLLLRCDDYHHRLVLVNNGADDVAFYGWEVKDRAALDTIARRIKDFGLEVAEGSLEDCAERMVLGLVKFTDPEGLAGEIYYGAFQDHTPFVSPRGIGPFVTGDMGLGHITIAAADPARYIEFYTTVLGAKISDYIVLQKGDVELKLPFLHVNPRHHSLVINRKPPGTPEGANWRRIGHMMMQMQTLDDVGRTQQLFETNRIPCNTLGKHPNDRMVSFYGRTPSGFDIEIGCGGVRIENEDEWQVQHYRAVTLWGHHPVTYPDKG